MIYLPGLCSPHAYEEGPIFSSPTYVGADLFPMAGVSEVLHVPFCSMAPSTLLDEMTARVVLG